MADSRVTRRITGTSSVSDAAQLRAATHNNRGLETPIGNERRRTGDR